MFDTLLKSCFSSQYFLTLLAISRVLESMRLSSLIYFPMSIWESLNNSINYLISLKDGFSLFYLIWSFLCFLLSLLNNSILSLIFAKYPVYLLIKFVCYFFKWWYCFTKELVLGSEDDNFVKVNGFFWSCASVKRICNCYRSYFLVLSWEVSEVFPSSSMRIPMFSRPVRAWFALESIYEISS